MNKNNHSYKETVALAIGELIVAALTVLGFFVADAAFGTGFSYNVITGAALGCAVIILNFFFLSVSVNRAVDKYLSERGTREMDDEEAEKFTAEHSMAIQNYVKTSYIVRTLTMVGALVLAFLLGDIFNPLAAAIPMLCYKPVLSLSEIFRRKYDKTPDASSFIEYNEEEKEDEI
ncbi:MAG: hypothetical protein IJW03_02900 [Clostridia bacterium]|nr:hypothetical protein [Clostridia bacterium]